MLNPKDEEERLLRWRIILGRNSDDDTPTTSLPPQYQAIDRVLEGVYGEGGLGNSAPRIAKTLEDARTIFPQSAALVIQKDAFERFGLQALLQNPKLLEEIDVDVNLVSMLVALSKLIPEKSKNVARALVKKLVDELMRKIQSKMIKAVRGALNRSITVRRPRHGELDALKTIRRNIQSQNWSPELNKLIIDELYGFGRKRRALYDVVIAVDESGSMARSVVYSSIFAATLAQTPSISTKLIFFDTSVVDMTERAKEPVDILFGAQLGGGTDIGQALRYCSSIITRPNKTILILISDLCEYGDRSVMYEQLANFVASGVKPICLLALDDGGTPSYDHKVATCVATLGIPTFGCTPDLFPDMFAGAIEGRDLTSWASGVGAHVVKPAQNANSDDKFRS